VDLSGPKSSASTKNRTRNIFTNKEVTYSRKKTRDVKNSIFWDVTSCNTVIDRRFGRIHQLRLQDHDVSQAKQNQEEIKSNTALVFVVTWSPLIMHNQRIHVNTVPCDLKVDYAKKRIMI
jgi:hypothetical protein